MPNFCIDCSNSTPLTFFELPIGQTLYKEGCEKCNGSWIPAPDLVPAHLGGKLIYHPKDKNNPNYKDE